MTKPITNNNQQDNKTQFDYEELKPHITNKICGCGWFYIIIVGIVVACLCCLIKCLVHQEIEANKATNKQYFCNHIKKQNREPTCSKKNKIATTNTNNTKLDAANVQYTQKGLDQTFNFSVKGYHSSNARLWLIAFLITIIFLLILSIPIFRRSEKKQLITLYLDDKELEHKFITDILKEVKENKVGDTKTTKELIEFIIKNIKNNTNSTDTDTDNNK